MKRLELLKQKIEQDPRPTPWELIKTPQFTWRSIYDTCSAEWNYIEIEEKVAILKLLVHSGYDLISLTTAYKAYYNEMNKEDVANDSENGILTIFEYILKNPS